MLIGFPRNPQNLEVDARRIAAKAEKGQDLRTAIVATRELTRIVELLAKLRGEPQQPQQVINVQVLAPVILDALASRIPGGACRGKDLRWDPGE